MSCWTCELLPPAWALRKAEPTTGGSRSRVQQYMFGNTLVSLVREHTKSAVTYILSKCRSFPLCFTILSYVSGSIQEGKGVCHYVTTHNSTARCRANHETSIVTQIIRLTCSGIEHSNYDISPTRRLLQVVSPPMWPYAKL
ncbi:hypothetical protein PoB_000249800 [Plakobranchus ocellatus]|uniref:Uncharacterized protein n=1 Tax=Plakobranchus ocellatus TaxID=259542 RepID=A0AAV3Y026_9GAST|nr:hypothetical protein PoB_000249800 [Plakobranchus ocellatus]